MGAPRYSSGKHAWGVCDRCGVSFRLHKLKALIINFVRTNLLVCRECWEEDHPQYAAGRKPVVDPQAIRNPRPDTGDIPSRRQWGWDPVGYNNVWGFGVDDMLEAVAELGTVTVVS